MTAFDGHRSAGKPVLCGLINEYTHPLTTEDMQVTLPNRIFERDRVEGDNEDHCDLPGSALGEGDRMGKVTGLAGLASQANLPPGSLGQKVRTTRSGLAERTSVF